jgi:glutathione-specific gamma-glutamylcyclotransferase
MAMKPNPPPMRLTPDHVARVTGKIDHPHYPPGASIASAAEHDDTMRAVLALHPAKDVVWVFAYGSLIWNRGFDHVEARTGILYGWHRAFCLGWDKWFRGNEQHPGLMLSLDRGGQCKGVLYRLPPDAVEANLIRLSQRELSFRPSAHSPRWLNVATEAGPVRAIVFVVDRDGGRYVSGLSIETIADMLASAVGHRGSMAEYLHNTVRHLEELGIRDGHLWRLQEMVAERIEARGEPSAIDTAP